MKLLLEELELRAVPVVGSLSDAPLAGRGSFYDGVVPVESGGALGTGGLFRRGAGQGYGHHIITSAHGTLVTTAATVTFELTRAGADVDIPVIVPAGPGYQIRDSRWQAKGDSYDTGLLKLVDQDNSSPTRLLVSPFTARQYEFHPPGVDVGGSIAKFAGYGSTGNGTSGMVNPAGKKRFGSNVLDRVTGPDFQYDFDDPAGASSIMGGPGLGADIEAVQVEGDSGSPVFVGDAIAGVEYAITPYGTPQGKFGDKVWVNRSSVILSGLVTPQVDLAGTYDLVLDMYQQTYGRSGPGMVAKGGVGPAAGAPEDITITAARAGDNLQLSVAGPDPALNGVYYSAPVAGIKSLTIRGSNDNETIVIDGVLGLSPSGDRKLTVMGRGGKDVVRIIGLDTDDAPPDAYGPITVDGGAMAEGNELYVDDSQSATDNTYTITASTLTRAGLDPITFGNFKLLDLKTGTGKNLVNQDGLPGDIRLQVAAGPTAHDKFAQLAGHSNDPTLTGFEQLDIRGGTLTLLGANGLAVRVMTQSGGTLAGTATVSASQFLGWTGGTMQDFGRTESLTYSVLNILGGVTLTDRLVLNGGLGIWDGTIAGGNGILQNDGTLDAKGTLSGALRNNGLLRPGAAGTVGRVTVRGRFTHSGTLEADVGPEGDASDQVVAGSVQLTGTLDPRRLDPGFPAKFYTVVKDESMTNGGWFGNAPHDHILTIDGKRYKMQYEEDKTNWSNAVLRRVVDVGLRTWEDKALNAARDADDPPVANVEAKLYRAADHALVGTTYSGTDGQYRFVDVVVDDYYLRFTAPDPAAWRFTLEDAVPDHVDSDLVRATGKTATFSLSPLDHGLTRDAGLYRLGGFGDRIWTDMGDMYGGVMWDGIQNEIQYYHYGAYVTVKLYDEAGTLVQTTSADAYGGYSFTGVELRDAAWAPIRYRVKFPGPGGGVYISPKDAGSDDAADSDAHPSTGYTDFYTLTYSGEHNSTVDIGVYSDDIVTGPQPTDPLVAMPMGRVPSAAHLAPRQPPDRLDDPPTPDDAPRPRVTVAADWQPDEPAATVRPTSEPSQLPARPRRPVDAAVPWDDNPIFAVWVG
jgi:hypothetical protein